ncbi:MAG: hypothetical protein ATN34_01505 [Epulopiscium sp. Nele67-Bin002]|nr:MAG: hypothetical protein ATN34_01505 [Epulopiscium sp. Nele67-Bin002]
MAYATNDLGAITRMTGVGIVIIFDALILGLMVIYNMATYVDLKLTLIAIIPMPFIAIGGIYLKDIINTRFFAKQQSFAGLSDLVQESFAGIRVIKSFVQEKYNTEEFEAVCNDNYDKNIDLAKISAILTPTMTLLVGLSLLTSIAYGGYMTMTNQISVGEFVAFNQYILMLSGPMGAISNAITMYAQGVAAIRRVEEVLNAPEIVIDTAESIHKDELDGSISIRNFNFDYPDTNSPALRDINLELKSGETLAILGRTGSGKTTLMNILLRFYNIDSDKVSIGGYDIMDLGLKSVRKNISYVPQDNFLFSDTVTNNIGFGLEHVELDEVVEAAKQANVHQNIVDFPKQYETVVGEKGTMLSGGQKQRISIARALILNAPILILDDSLSAVDTKTEEAILDNLKTVRNGKTNIIIAHRISTVRNADKIVVMDNGKIAEQGTHESLVALGGIYANMYEQQKLDGAKGDYYER